MSKDISNNEILQAIKELSEQIGQTDKKLEKTEQRLTTRIDETDKRLTDKIDMVNSKLSILSDNLLKTQAEVKVLKNAE